MSNKRVLKKRIQQVCGEAAVEVMMNAPEHLAGQIVVELANLQNSALANVSFSFDHARKDYDNARAYNKARKAYTRAAFRQLRKDFTTGLVEIVKEMNAAMTQEERQANIRADK